MLAGSHPKRALGSPLPRKLLFSDGLSTCDASIADSDPEAQDLSLPPFDGMTVA